MKDRSKYYDLGIRLRDERERLGYLQNEFGAQGEVTRMSQVGYESGNRPPTAAYLAKIARLGADVQYIVTGVRSNNLHEIETADQRLYLLPDEIHYVESKEIDKKLLGRILEKVGGVTQLVGYTATPAAKIAKVTSIIYENKVHSDKRTLPSDDAIKSMFDLIADD